MMYRPALGKNTCQRKGSWHNRSNERPFLGVSFFRLISSQFLPFNFIKRLFSASVGSNVSETYLPQIRVNDESGTDEGQDFGMFGTFFELEILDFVILSL